MIHVAAAVSQESLVEFDPLAPSSFSSAATRALAYVFVVRHDVRVFKYTQMF
jgi:hypothetical protein